MEALQSNPILFSLLGVEVEALQDGPEARDLRGDQEAEPSAGPHQGAHQRPALCRHGRVQAAQEEDAPRQGRHLPPPAGTARARQPGGRQKGTYIMLKQINSFNKLFWL